MSKQTQNVSIRVDVELLARIDHNALQHGQSRTEYILSWLPDTYDGKTKQPEDTGQQPQR